MTTELSAGRPELEAARLLLSRMGISPEDLVATPVALGITLVIHTLVALAALLALGPDKLAAATDPLASAVAAGSWSELAPAVRVGAAVAALGSPLALVLGVSRTTSPWPVTGTYPGH
jgi:APA family basic amino acid/polyamine antiporter